MSELYRSTCKGVVTNYGEEGGGVQSGREGASPVLPLQKVAGVKPVLAMLKGGGGRRHKF